MIIKILGLIDIFTGLLFWMIGVFGFGSKSLLMLFGILLLIKGIVFMTSLNIISAIDIITGVVMISLAGSEWMIPKIIVIIISLFLLQKGIISIVS